MSQPLISVGLPVFNGEKFLPGTLANLLEQDFGDFELIICDNASSDGTEAICRDFAARDRRIRYSRNESNIGATGNYNRVFQLSSAPFFKWASHDDECHPSLLRRCFERFQEAPKSAVLVYSKADIIDEEGRILYPSPDSIHCASLRPYRRLARVLFRSAFAHPLWGLVRSDALRKTRLMGCLEADHVLLAELALLGQLIEIPETLYRLRRHAGCATQIKKSARELLAWHDPKRVNDRIILPHWERVYIEYLRGINHIPLSAPQRLICYGSVPAVSYWRRFLRWSGAARRKIGLSRTPPGNGGMDPIREPVRS